MNTGAVVVAGVPPLPRLAPPAPRAGVVGPARLALRQFLLDYERDLAGAFIDGADVEALVQARARAVEKVLSYAWQSWFGVTQDAALLATGGFGRGELFPYSDIDLLVLTVPAAEPRVLRAIEAFCACLWDVGLKPGLAVRDLATCRALAAEDVSVYTSLLDARMLDGAQELAASLLRELPDESLWASRRFLTAKNAEQSARHLRFGDTAYNLEPHLKDGPGGLRDLQMIGWLGRALAGSSAYETMIEAGLLDAGEAEALADARKTLYRIRYALHRQARRAEERLLFDYQRDLAQALGYRDVHSENLAVEQCMQDYFRAARRIGAANEEMIARCLELLSPSVVESLALPGGFVRVGDRLDVVDSARLKRQPEALIELYALLATESGIRGLRANALREVRMVLANKDLDFDRPEVYAVFRRLLERGAPAVDALAAMARHGVLARLIPGFAQVTGRMQYDLFHVYTVDEHTLRVLQFIARFSSESGGREFPLAYRVYRRLPQPSLLLLAGLFHDIAKGRGGDHSELGEVDASQFCAKLQLGATASSLVAWLVRWHLLMSVTAQRQDISDPEIVQRFADQVSSWERLDYLYLLTVADINGTSPKLWNSWRDRLLSDLYAATRYVLRAESDELPQKEERIAENRERTKELLLESGLDSECVARIWADFPDESFLRYRPEQIAWQTRVIAHRDSLDAPLVSVNPLGTAATSEVFVYCADRDGLFATITAVLDRANLNVHEARLVPSNSSRVLDTFFVLDARGQPISDPHDVAALENAIRRALRPEVLNEPPARRVMPRALRHFHIAPEIVFTAAGAQTRLSLVCSDRPGLLASVARVFRKLGVRVHDARIATFGERVEDFFRITDENDLPLDAEGQQELSAALLEQFGSSAPETKKVSNART
jgi:[protein-PII] uridylyltransferase